MQDPQPSRDAVLDEVDVAIQVPASPAAAGGQVQPLQPAHAVTGDGAPLHPAHAVTGDFACAVQASAPAYWC